MKGASISICFIASLCWSGFFLLVALLMSTGLADEPGDTNGFRRFATIVVIFVVPGIAASVFSYRERRRRMRFTRSAARAFPVEPVSQKTQTPKHMG